jgi:hypothetical protein
MMTNRRIVCAALKYDSRIICGARHYDERMIEQIELSALDWRKAEQGFIDQHGTFLDRVEAWKIADAQGQIIRDRDWSTGVLHSEHLY